MREASPFATVSTQQTHRSAASLSSSRYIFGPQSFHPKLTSQKTEGAPGGTRTISPCGVPSLFVNVIHHRGKGLLALVG